MKKSDSGPNQKILQAAGLGMELVGLVVVLVYAGRQLDLKYGWPGYGMTGGGLIALAGWLSHVLRIARAVEEEDSQSK